MAFYLQDTKVILRPDNAPLENLLETKQRTFTNNWVLEIFLITPYITFKHKKGKDNFLADILTQLQRLGLYENYQYEEDDQDQEITIFDDGESVEVTADPESFTPPDLNMIPTVTNNTSANANHCLDRDTFVLNDVTYVIDDGHPIKPQIYLMPLHIRRIQLQNQSLAIIIKKLRKNKVHSTTLPNTFFLNDDSVLYWM